MDSAGVKQSHYSDLFREHYLAVLDHRDESIWSIDRNYRVVDHNPAFYNRYVSITGNAAVKGESVLNPLFGQAFVEAWKSHYDYVFDTGLPHRYREVGISLTKENGNYYEVRMYPINDGFGVAYAIICVSHDLTNVIKTERELELANEELARSIELYRALATKTPNFGVVIFDRDYRFLLCEGSALHAVGLSKWQYEGRTMFEAMGAQERSVLKPQYDAALAGNSVKFEYDSKGRNYLVQILPIMDVTGAVIRGMVIVNDVTEIKKAEQLLAQANKELEHEVAQLEASLEELQSINRYLDDFVHAAAHDLRSPIVNLKTILNLLGRIDNEEEKQLLLDKVPELVESVGNTLDGLIRMVEYQKKDQQIVTALYFEQVLDEVKDVFRDEIFKKKAKIVSDFTAVPMVWYIEPKLNSIFFNLISNSLKYASQERDAIISISSRNQDGFVVLEFKDNGLGIDLYKYKELLFRPFKRFAGNSVSGTGLGLSLVKSIVEKNGGNITVSSEVNDGTVFTVLLKPYKAL